MQLEDSDTVSTGLSGHLGNSNEQLSGVGG